MFSLALNTEALVPRKGVSPSKREIPRCCFLPQGRVYRKEVSASIQNGICRPDGQIFALRQQRFPPFMGGSKTGPPPFREGFNRPAGGERGGSNAASFMSGPESFPSRAVASVNPSAGHAATLSHRSRISRTIEICRNRSRLCSFHRSTKPPSSLGSPSGNIRQATMIGRLR